MGAPCGSGRAGASNAEIPNPDSCSDFKTSEPNGSNETGIREVTALVVSTESRPMLGWIGGGVPIEAPLPGNAGDGSGTAGLAGNEPGSGLKGGVADGRTVPGTPACGVISRNRFTITSLCVTPGVAGGFPASRTDRVCDRSDILVVMVEHHVVQAGDRVVREHGHREVTGNEV